LTSLDGLANVARLTSGEKGIELFERLTGIASEMKRMINKLSMMNFIHQPSDLGCISPKTRLNL